MTRWTARAILALLVALAAYGAHTVKVVFVGGGVLWIEGHGHTTTLLDIIGVSVVCVAGLLVALAVLAALVTAARGDR